MKVLRVWLDGQSTATTKNTPITSYNDLEPNTIGTFDDTVLKLLDAFMIDSHARGIKVSPVTSIFTHTLSNLPATICSSSSSACTASTR